MAGLHGMVIEKETLKSNKEKKLMAWIKARAKDPKKKKDLGQAHRVYQRYIDTNKKSKD